MLNVQANAQIKEIDRRLLSYRDKIIVLVDDGIATGATILASANWLKNNQRCRKLLIAVPVAPRSMLNLNQVVDDVRVLYTPEDFMAVGAFYQNFAQIEDEIMKR